MIISPSNVKGGLLQTYTQSKFLFYIVILLMIALSLGVIYSGFDFLIFIYKYTCLPHVYVFFIFLLFFTKNNFKIYEKGIDVPKYLFQRILLFEKIYYSYNEIKSIYPGIYEVALGPGTNKGEYDTVETPGVTTQFGLKVELLNGKKYFIKFNFSMLSSLEYANQSCIDALEFLRNLYIQNNWVLIKDPPNLTEIEIQEYKWIVKRHNTRNEKIEGNIALVVLSGSIIGLGELSKRLNIEMTSGLLIIIVAISALPIFIWIIVLMKRDKEKYRKINLLIKYWESQKERNLLAGDPTIELMRKKHIMIMRQMPNIR